MTELYKIFSELVDLQIQYLVPDLDDRKGVFTKVLATEGTEEWEGWSRQVRMASKLWEWKMKNYG